MNSNLKKIIISMLATTALTACGGGGGGGGGGGSSSPEPLPPIPTPPAIQKPDIDNAEVGVEVGESGAVFKKDDTEKILRKSGANVIGAKGKFVDLKDGETIEINDLQNPNSPLAVRADRLGVDTMLDLTGYSIGITSENGKVVNNGNIILSGDSTIGIYSNNSIVINNGNIIGNGRNIIGILGTNFTNEKDIINNGEIKLSGTNAIGIKLHNANGVNNKTIEIDSYNGIGISVVGDNYYGSNNGKIDIYNYGVGVYAGYGATGRNNGAGVINIHNRGFGMYADNGGHIINEGKISIYALGEGGMVATGIGSIAENGGDIDIYNNEVGMYADSGAKVINNSTGDITIHGRGYGMYASNGGHAINEGTIRLSKVADGAMIANGTGSVAENRGTIIFANTSIMGKELQSINGGTVLNNGEIKFDTSAVVNAVDGRYVIGTAGDRYGKIKAKNIKVDGNVAIDGSGVKGSYKDSYIFDNVLEANKIEFGKNYKLLSDSLLYDSKLEEDSEGNYDGELMRNDKVLSDFTDNNYLSSSKILDSYFSEKEYNSLNGAGKKLIDSIDISNKENLNRNLKDLTPSIYANNLEMVEDIEEKFNNNREKIIADLGEEECNFSLITGYNKFDSEESIAGYKMQSTGIVGVFALKDKNYLSLGYSYNDVDYREGNGDGNIHSLYLAFDKQLDYNKFNINFGVAGEYNIHEVNRDMDSFNTTGESDFNSYMLKTYGKISKKYSDIVDTEPYAKLNLGYYNFEDIEEDSDITKIKIDSEEYFSIKPEIGTSIAKEIKDFTLYTKLNYSYELGDLDKDLEYRYDGIDTRGKINANQEDEEFNFEIGLGYKKNNISFNIETGRSFGERDNKFIGGKIGYRF